MTGKEKIEKTIENSKKIVGKTIDKSVEIGITVKEYLVDDTLNDAKKLLTLKKKDPPRSTVVSDTDDLKKRKEMK